MPVTIEVLYTLDTIEILIPPHKHYIRITGIPQEVASKIRFIESKSVTVEKAKE